MKKLLSLVAIVSAIMFTSCSVSPQDGLKAIADMSNAICPAEQAEGVVLSSVAFENNQMVYNVQVSEENLANFSEAAKDAIIASLQTEQNKDLVDLLKMAKADIVYNYIGEESGDSVQIVITSDEL